jgi:ABC-type sugar transport system permease subunit
MMNDNNHFFSRETWTALGFLLPLVVFVVIFILVPVMGTLTDSFFLDVTYRPRRFLGADNFI